MKTIPSHSGADVTVAAPPPSCARMKDEIVATKYPGGGAHGSPAWSELEEDEGAMLVSAIEGTEPGGEEAQAQADKSLTQASGPPAK
jgi:hypothetical protein